MRVDIWSDVVCPWCYIGKARFEKALAGFEHRREVEVSFRSFELDPSAVPGGTQTNLQMLSQKLGVPLPQVHQMEERVAGLARAEGLRYQLERPNGNTFDLHRLLHLGRDKGVQGALLDAIYAANFAEAQQVFDPPVITEIATSVGLDAGDVAKIFATSSGNGTGSDAYAAAVRADEDEARRLGISGVPFFAFDMKIGVSGAQATEAFTQALAQAWRSGQETSGPAHRGEEQDD